MLSQVGVSAGASVLPVEDVPIRRVRRRDFNSNASPGRHASRASYPQGRPNSTECRMKSRGETRSQRLWLRYSIITQGFAHFLCLEQLEKWLPENVDISSIVSGIKHSFAADGRR